MMRTNMTINNKDEELHDGGDMNYEQPSAIYIKQKQF